MFQLSERGAIKLSNRSFDFMTVDSELVGKGAERHPRGG
jgi:hypothetical protein